MKNRSVLYPLSLDSPEDQILLDSARIAASKAIRISSALGITYKIIKDYEIIAVSPDKSKKILGTISQPTVDVSGLKKGMILERK